MNNQPIVYLLLGTNIGDRTENLIEAQQLLENKTGKIIQSSAIYETEPWGLKEQPAFYNQAIKMRTRYKPEELMKILLTIEQEMGRIRTIKNAARIIDIDILFYSNFIIKTPSLTIPHPEIQNRRFALSPLCELDPDYLHPVLHKTIRELLAECPDPLKATRLSTT